MSDPNRIDKLFRDKLSKRDFKADDAAWQDALEMIEAHERSRRFPKWLWGGIVLLGIGVGLYSYTASQNAGSQLAENDLRTELIEKKDTQLQQETSSEQERTGSIQDETQEETVLEPSSERGSQGPGITTDEVRDGSVDPVATTGVDKPLHKKEGTTAHVLPTTAAAHTATGTHKAPQTSAPAETPSASEKDPPSHGSPTEQTKPVNEVAHVNPKQRLTTPNDEEAPARTDQAKAASEASGQVAYTSQAVEQPVRSDTEGEGLVQPMTPKSLETSTSTPKADGERADKVPESETIKESTVLKGREGTTKVAEQEANPVEESAPEVTTEQTVRAAKDSTEQRISQLAKPPSTTHRSLWDSRSVIHASSGMGIGSHSISGGPATSIIDQGISFEMAPSLSFEYLYQFKGIHIGSGFNYTQTKAELSIPEREVSTFQFSDTVIFFQDSVWVLDTNQVGSWNYFQNSDTIQDTTITTVQVPAERSSIVLSYLRVPLFVAYRRELGNFHLGLDFGPTLNIMTSQKGVYPNQALDANATIPTEQFRSLSLGYMLRPVIHYALSDQLSIGIEPYIFGSFQGTTKEGVLSDQRVNSYGVAFGVNYALSKE